MIALVFTFGTVAIFVTVGTVAAIVNAPMTDPHRAIVIIGKIAMFVKQRR
jgi:hypothetical protein